MKKPIFVYCNKADDYVEITECFNCSDNTEIWTMLGSKPDPYVDCMADEDLLL